MAYRQAIKQMRSKLSERQLVKVLRGIVTLAHNRRFTCRELEQYVEFRCKGVLSSLVKKGVLEVRYMPLSKPTYYPTGSGWDWLEAEISMSGY